MPVVRVGPINRPAYPVNFSGRGVECLSQPSSWIGWKVSQSAQFGILSILDTVPDSGGLWAHCPLIYFTCYCLNCMETKTSKCQYSNCNWFEFHSGVCWQLLQWILIIFQGCLSILLSLCYDDYVLCVNIPVFGLACCLSLCGCDILHLPVPELQ